MAEDELATFRKRWRDELRHQREGHRVVSTTSSSWGAAGGSDQDRVKSSYFEDSKANFNEADDTVKTHRAADGRVGEERERGHGRDSEQQPDYVSIAHSLLDGRTSPLLDRIQEERTRRKRKLYHNINNLQEKQHQQEGEPPDRKDKATEKLLDQLILDLVGSRSRRQCPQPSGSTG